MTKTAQTTGSAALTTEAPPYVDCIQWVPRRFAGGPSPVTTADVVLTQPTIKAIRHHVASQSEASVFGLILGQIREDPTCARPWVLASAVQRGPAIAGDPSADTLQQILEHMSAGHEQLESTIVGWYRSHPGAGLYLSPEEAQFHQMRFADAWGFSLILVGDAGRFTGALFQQTDPEGLSRSAYTPFYELVDPSSEFNGTTRRTFVAWPNYQTETRIVQAGHGSVSAQIPEGEGVVMEPPAAPEVEAEAPAPAATTPAPNAAPTESATPKAAAPKAEPKPSETVQPAEAREPAPPAPAPADKEPEGDIDLDYEKRQIERSLMAVGRSIGPAALGELGTPVPVDTVKEPAVRRPAESAAAPEDAVPDASGSAEDRSVIPIHGPTAPTPKSEPGLVGRSRRRKIPLGKILSAAAGIALLAASSWFGARMLRDQTPALAADDGAESGDRGSAMAGLSLAPTDLFMENVGSVTFDTAETGGEDSSGPDVDSIGAEAIGTATEASLALESGGEGGEMQTAAGAENPGDLASEPTGTEDLSAFVGPEQPVTPRPEPEAQRRREPEIVAAPELEIGTIGDPTLSAYENALGIFRQEIGRYESTRTEFDDGSGTCNPLNLAFRGVRESYQRLDRRYQSAAESLAAPQLRSFDGAKRQVAMVETHYSLTDCPMPPS